MNAAHETRERAAVVAGGTLTAVVLLWAAVALLHLGSGEPVLLHENTIETGLVDLPSSAAPTRAQPRSPAPAKPPPKAAEPQLPPAPALPPPPAEPAIAPPAESVPLPKPSAPQPAAQASVAPPPVQTPTAPPPPPTSEPQPATGNARSAGAGGTGSARALYQPLPVVPPELRSHAFDQVAVVRFTIGIDGKATVSLEQATPDPQINQVLLDTFRRWRFFPAMRQGKPVSSTLVLRVPVKVE
jgi:periplasmic protein TonB